LLTTLPPSAKLRVGWSMSASPVCYVGMSWGDL